MKSYSLVRKFGSCIGFTTLTLGLFSNLGSQVVSAEESFLESKFFKIFYNLFSDEDLNAFDEKELFESNSVLNLKKEDYEFLDELQTFCFMNCDEKFQKDETVREISLDFKKNFGNIIKKRLNLEKEDYVYLDKLDRFLSRQYNKNFQKNEFLAQIASRLRNIINAISGGFLDLKEKDLIFLVKLKKFCDKNCDEKYQEDKLKRQRANELREKIEVILNGNIEKKIDEFFKSDFFAKNIEYFTGSNIPEQNKLVLKMLSIDEKNYGEWFSKNSPSLFAHAFCAERADDLKTTGYARFHLILSLWEIINFSKEILNDENYVNKLGKEDYTRYSYCFRVFSSDLIKFKIFTEEEVCQVLSALYDKENIGSNKKLENINKIIKESSFYDLDFKKRLVRLQSLHTMSNSYYKALDEMFKKFSDKSIKSAFYEVLDNMISEGLLKGSKKMEDNKDSKIFQEGTINLNKPSENEILKENPKELPESEIDKIAESIADMVLNEISEENLGNSIFEEPEGDTFESVFNKSFNIIYGNYNCTIQ